MPAIAAPSSGATQNSQSCVSAQPPAINAGPVLRAGFTDVFVTGMLIRWMSVRPSRVLLQQPARPAPVRRVEKRMRRPTWIAGYLAALVAGFLVVSDVSAQSAISCRPNIFGGEDCAHPDGRRSTSRPNIFGGYDTTFADGTRWTSRENIFDGQDITTPEGTIRSRANVFGGQDYQLPDGGRIESRSNIFDGQDFRLPDGRRVVCRRNIFGGQDCR